MRIILFIIRNVFLAIRPSNVAGVEKDLLRYGYEKRRESLYYLLTLQSGSRIALTKDKQRAAHAVRYYI